MRYALAGDEALRLWLALRDASVARLAEVERAARDYLGDDVEAIGREELIERLRRGDVVLVDVRPSEEFEAGHIEGARSIPIDELERPAGRAAGRPRGRGLLPRPVLRLRARGGPARCRPPAARARRLEEGWPEWRLARDRGAGRMSKPRSRSTSTSCARRSARPTPTSPPTPTQDFIFPTGRAWAQELGYPRARARRACPTRPSRASPASPTTGRSAASSRARSCSTSAAAPAPTC